MDEIDETMIRNSIKYQQICFAVFFFFLWIATRMAILLMLFPKAFFFFKELHYELQLLICYQWEKYTHQTPWRQYFSASFAWFSAQGSKAEYFYSSQHFWEMQRYEIILLTECVARAYAFFKIETCHIWDEMNSKGKKKRKSLDQQLVVYSRNVQYSPHSQWSFCNCSQSVQSR